MDRKALTYIGILIAVDAFLWNYINQKAWFVLIDVGVLVLCIIINRAEFWFYNSHHKWIDLCYYIIAKNERPYKVENKKLEYSILSEDKATFKSNSSIYVTKVKDFSYKAQYLWEQKDDVGFELENSGNYKVTTTDECCWTSVDIKPISPIGKKHNLNVGFSLNTLTINNLIRHSFLSHKVTEKIKDLSLIANVSQELEPTNGELIVKNIYGIEIKREPVLYDKDKGSFTATIYCPRKGRNYILQWGYKRVVGD